MAERGFGGEGGGSTRRGFNLRATSVVQCLHFAVVVFAKRGTPQLLVGVIDG